MTIRRVLVLGHPFDDPVRTVEATVDGAHLLSTDWVAELDGLRGERYDLVIVDYPRAAQAVATFEQAAVIVVSDRTGEDLAVHMMRLGAADYLLASRLDQLAPAIDRALGAVQRRRAHPTRDDLARLLLVHSLDLVVSVDAAGRLLVVNDAVRSFLGYSPEELIGKEFSMFLHADDVDRALASFRAGLDGELVGNIECRCLHRSGEVRHAIWSVVVTQADVVTVIGHDITARKRAEEKVLQERDYADAIINSLPGIFFHYDDGMRLLRWNRTVAQATGYSDDDLATMHPQDFIAPTDHALAAAAIAEVFGSGTTQGEMRYVFKDGTQVRYVFNALRFDYEGRPGFVGVGIDISERERVEEELRKERALFEAMVQNAPDGILVVDRDNRRIIQNQRLKDLWRIPSDIADLADTERLLEFISSRTREPDTFDGSMRRLMDDPTATSSDEVELVDGTILHRLSGPVIGDDGRFYGRLWSFRDITGYRDVERQLRHRATHDPLTGLPNRSLAEQRVEQAISLGRAFTLLFIDLDGFKSINDTFGHVFGDAALKAVGDRLLELVGHGDTVARLGGDEFLVLLPETGQPGPAESLAQRIGRSLTAPLLINGTVVGMPASVGVSLFPRDGETLAELLRHADVAMYQAKRQGAQPS